MKNLPDAQQASSGSQKAVENYPPSVVRRSLIMSTLGSTIGAFFFPLLSGNILNRYLEFIELKHRIGLFLALSALAGVFQIFGSWVVQRTGYRRLFFFLFAAPPRLMWMAIVTIPLWGPANPTSRIAVLGGLYFLYWLLNGVSSTAWFSWMRDIVPEDYRSKLWSYRATLITLVSAVWAFGVGYFLEAMGIYLSSFIVIYAIGVFFGLVDLSCFFLVHHPKMELKSGDEAELIPMVKAAMHRDFLKFAGVQSIWWFSCTMVFLSSYHLMRGINMEIFSIQTASFYNTIVFLVFSLLWGRFIHKYGSKATFCIGMIVHGIAPIVLAFAALYGPIMVYLSFGLMGMSVSGIELANTNLLFTLSKRDDQAMTVAARSVIAGTVQACGYLICENVLYPVLKAIGAWLSFGPLFYVVVVYLLAAGMRGVVFLLALRLPEVEDKPPAGIIVKMFYATNPLRALYSMGKYLQLKSRQLVGDDDYAREHPSARWQEIDLPDERPKE